MFSKKSRSFQKSRDLYTSEIRQNERTGSLQHIMLSASTLKGPAFRHGLAQPASPQALKLLRLTIMLDQFDLSVLLIRTDGACLTLDDDCAFGISETGGPTMGPGSA
jgi:hypothetical protein